MQNSKKFLISAAVSGILSASIASVAHAAAASNDDGAMGRCMGANSCKNTSDCSMKNSCKAKKNGCKGKSASNDKNSCNGKNGCGGSAKGANSCKGTGFVATTQEDCKKLRDADIASSDNHKSKIHFVKGLPADTEKY